MGVNDKNLRLYLHGCERQENGSKIFNHVFDTSMTFSNVFDHLLSDDDISIFPLKKDPVFVVHTKSSNPNGQLPNLPELFLSKFVTKYQQFKQHMTSIKISFVTIDTSKYFSTSESVIDRLNQRALDNIHDASIFKCDSVGLALALLAESNHNFKIKTMSCLSIMSFRFKENFNAYFLHTHTAYESFKPSCWEERLEWEDEALRILELAGMVDTKDLNFWFVVPDALKPQAVDCRNYYTLEKPYKDFNQDVDELDQNVSLIRSDLNLISNFLVNNSARMAQELDYQSDGIDERKMKDMEKELEMLQGKLHSLLGSKAESNKGTTISDEERKNMELLFQEQQQRISISSVVPTSLPRILRPIEEPQFFLHIRSMNAIEKSKRSRNCVNLEFSDTSDLPHSLKINDPLEEEHMFRYNFGIYETKDTAANFIHPALLNDLTAGDNIFSNTNFWILGSQSSCAESILFGVDYSTVVKEKGNTKGFEPESLLGKIVQSHLPEKYFSVSYLCITENRAIDLLNPSNEMTVAQKTPCGINHNGSVIGTNKEELWKLILYAHGMLDINLNVVQKSRCSLLLQLSSPDGRCINVIKLGIGHTHALLTNITGKSDGGVGGMFHGLLQHSNHRSCLCISPSSFGLTETIYWLNLTKILEKVQRQGQTSNLKKDLISPKRSRDIKVNPAIQLDIQSEALTNLRVENLQLIQIQNKLEHDYAILAFRHKHTLQTLHTILKLYHTLSSNITHYACKDALSIMQRTPGVAPVVDLIKLGEIESMMSKLGLDSDEGVNWMITNPSSTSGKDESKGLLVHDIEVPNIQITKEGLEKSGIAMVEAKNDDIPDINDVQAWAGDLSFDPKTDLEKLARIHIDLQVKYSDLNRACGDMFESIPQQDISNSKDSKTLILQRPKSRLQLSRELVKLRKVRDIRTNENKKLLRSLMEAGVTIKSQNTKLVDQRNDLRNMEEQYSNLQNIFSKMVTDFHANEKNYQENVSYLTQLLNAITLGGNYYESGEVLARPVGENMQIDDDNSENSPPTPTST